MTRSSLRDFLAFREFTGLHMLVVTVTFFAVVIAANVALAVLATTSWSGLLARNGYVASIDYARAMERREAAATLGWTVEAAIDGDVVTLTLRDRDGHPLFRPEVEALASRPVTEHDDRPLRFAAAGGGVYRSTEPLATGVWNLDATVRTSSDAVTRHFRLHVDGD